MAPTDFADTIRLARRRYPMTQAEMATALASSGWKFKSVAAGRATIAKIESQSRGVSFDEAILMAAAVALSHFQVTLPSGDVVEVSFAGPMFPADASKPSGTDLLERLVEALTDGAADAD